MLTTRTQQKAIARLQQMACLDFNGPELIEPVLHELHQVIGFGTGAYFYEGSTGALDAFVEPSLARDLMHTYFDSEVQRSERKVVRRSAHDFSDAVRYEHGPQILEQLITVPVPELLRSDFYNLALRPAEVFDCMSLVLRTPQGTGVGTIKLYKSVAMSRFSVEDVAMLGRLEHWLARILQPGERQRDAARHSPGAAVMDIRAIRPVDGACFWTRLAPPLRAAPGAADAA